MRRGNVLSIQKAAFAGCDRPGVELLESRRMLAPVIKDEAFTINENQPALLNILQIDQTVPGNDINPGTVVVPVPPGHGTITSINPAGEVTYLPNANYIGRDSFAFQVENSIGQISNLATVTLYVYPPAPIANNDFATTAENTPVAIAVLANDQIPTGDTFETQTMMIVQQPSNGSTSINYNTGVITYTPSSGFLGTDTFSYQIEGSEAVDSNVATVTVDVTPQPPVANNDSALTAVNTPVAINLLANDTDPNPPSVAQLNPATVKVVGSPADGSVTINPNNGVATYTPNANFVGKDSFQYTVNDTTGLTSNVATVSVSVLPRPVAGALSATTNEQVPVPLNVLSVDSDSAAAINPGSVAIVGQPANGVAVVESDGEILYTPNYNFFGTDTLQYTVADTHGIVSLPGTVTITVNFVSKAPVAVDDVYGTSVNTPVAMPVLSNDYEQDPPSKSTIDDTSVTVVTQPAHGSASLNAATGLITYTPDPGYAGADALTYTVKNTLGLTSSLATVYIRVGSPVTLSGEVWVDSNDNDKIDSGEVGVPGVTITATLTSGPIPFSVTTTTGANGAYSFAEGNAADHGAGGLAATGSFVLPAGTYTLTETQPVYFVGGGSAAGTPAPTSSSSTAFAGITLAPGQAATGFDFAQLGLKAQYIATYVTGRAFFASSDPTVSGLNMAQGAAYFSFDGGTPAVIAANAFGAAGDGSVTLTLYNAGMQVVATSTSASGTTSLQASGAPGTPYILEVSGTNTAVNVQVAALDGSPQPWHNPTNAMDVNGDGKVTPADALAVIDALNTGGSGALPLKAEQPGTAPDYLDVEDTGTLSPADALAIIDYLNTNPAPAAVAPQVEAASVTSNLNDGLNATTAPASVGLTSAAPGENGSAAGTSPPNNALTAGLVDQAISQLTPANIPTAVPVSPAVVAQGMASAGSTAIATVNGSISAVSPPVAANASVPGKNSDSPSTPAAGSLKADDTVWELLGQDEDEAQQLLFG